MEDKNKGVKKYSFWLIPDEENIRKFSGIIRNLSEKYATPLFFPHITLVGGYRGEMGDFLVKAKKIANNQKKLRFQLGSLGFSEVRHKALFINVLPNYGLTRLFERSSEILSYDNPVFSPHMSLLYGDLPAAEKEKIIAGLGKEFSDILLIEKLSLFDTDDSDEGKWFRVKDYLFF